MDTSFRLNEFWYDRVFEPVYDLILGNGDWLFGFLLTAVCLCRLGSLILFSRTPEGRRAGTDIVCRCLWYVLLTVLAWNGPLLEAYYVYVDENPDSGPAQLLPPRWGLLWLHAFVITLLMISGMPRQPSRSRLVAGCELTLFVVTGSLVLWTVIPQSIQWLVMMFNMLVEWSLRQPHILTEQLEYGRDVPQAMRLAGTLSLASVLSCLASMVLLFPVRRRRHLLATAVMGVVCLLMSLVLIWYLDHSVIDRISPSFSDFTLTHQLLTRLPALVIVIPGVGWIGWWAITHTMDEGDVIDVSRDPRSAVRLVETVCAGCLTLCAWLELSRQTIFAVKGFGDSFGFYSWAVTFLCCLRTFRWNLLCYRGALDAPVDRYCAGLSGVRVILYSSLALIQLGTLALGLYWLVGLQALWPDWS